LTPLPYATAIGEDATSKAVALVRFAALMEDFEQLGRIVERYEGDDRTGLSDDSIWQVWALGLAATKGEAKKARGEDGDPLTGFEAAINAERGRVAVRPTQEFAYAVAGATLARAAGNDKAARKYHDDAQTRLDSLDPTVSPQMLALAQHWANALALFPESSKAKSAAASRAMAQGFFREFFEKGYGSYARFL
jgi:hypothetical protein